MYKKPRDKNNERHRLDPPLMIVHTTIHKYIAPYHQLFPPVLKIPPLSLSSSHLNTTYAYIYPHIFYYSTCVLYDRWRPGNFSPIHTDTTIDFLFCFIIPWSPTTVRYNYIVPHVWWEQYTYARESIVSQLHRSPLYAFK